METTVAARMGALSIACLLGMSGCGGNGFGAKSEGNSAPSDDAGDVDGDIVVVTGTPMTDGGADSRAEAGVREASLDDAIALSTVSGQVIVGLETYNLAVGTVVPIAGRQVVLLDSTGKRSEVVTDSLGGFTVAGITPPYDALVAAPSGAGAGAFPVVYASLNTLHPRLQAGADPVDADASPDGSTPSTLRSAFLKIPLTIPSCPTCGLASVLVVDDSTGVQLTGANLGSNPGQTSTLELQAQWRGAASTIADVYVLAFDAVCANYWYASYSGVQVQDGNTTQVPETIVPAPLSTIGTFTLTATETGVPTSWGAPNLMVSIALPNSQALAELPSVQSTSVSIGVPNLLGATLQVGATVQSPSGTLRASGGDSAGGLPLTTTTTTLAVHGPPVIGSPPSQGSVSASTGAITWTSTTTAQVYYADLAFTGDGGDYTDEVYVLTSGGSIDLGRLSRLGVQLAPGATVLSLSGVGNVASLDSVVDESSLASPDGTADSYVGWPFVVTP